MSHVDFFLRGWLIGLAIAAPVGPIGVLCIRRTLSDGRLTGFLSGLGAATADMVYGAIAAFGVTTLQQALLRQQALFRLIGGVFLLYLGIRTFLARPATSALNAEPNHGRLSAYLTTLGLTITNPATILSFSVVFVALRLGEARDDAGMAAAMVFGVFFGSATWWLVLSGIVGIFRQRFTTAWMSWVNRLAGVVILAFGLAALLAR